MIHKVKYFIPLNKIIPEDASNKPKHVRLPTLWATPAL